MKIKFIWLVALLNIVFVTNVTPFNVALNNERAGSKNYIVETSGELSVVSVNETNTNSFGLLMTPIKQFIVNLAVFALISKVFYSSYDELFNMLIIYPLGELAPPFSYNY